MLSMFWHIFWNINLNHFQDQSYKYGIEFFMAIVGYARADLWSCAIFCEF